MAILNIKTSIPIDRQFITLSERYSRFLKEAGAEIQPYRSAEIPHFLGLSQEKQVRALEEVKNTLEIYSEMREAGQNLRDSPKLLWRSLRRMGQMGMTPCSDIFDRIAEEDVVCVYTLEHVQIFQNLRFLELVSLTIEEIYCTEWYKYSIRPQWAQSALIKLGADIASGKIQSTIDPQIDEHIVLQSDRDTGFSLKLKWASPIKDQGKIAGVIIVNRSKVIDPRDYEGRF